MQQLMFLKLLCLVLYLEAHFIIIGGAVGLLVIQAIPDLNQGVVMKETVVSETLACLFVW